MRRRGAVIAVPIAVEKSFSMIAIGSTEEKNPEWLRESLEVPKF
jgi:hypothetical protein